MEITPKKGLQGLIENWQSDLIAAVSVSLIALPLSLGIALAAGAPAMSGILSAIVGGVVTTLYRGGHISVNGPAKGVIAVILLGITLMDDGSGQAFNYVLAAVVVSGAIQVVLGLLKLGRLADIFHSSVIHGLLAAIGIIIFAKQIHVALGTHSDSPSIIQNLVDAVMYLPEANPFVVIIALAGLLLLLFHSKISYRFFHILPAPMWVIALSIPFVYAFGFFEQHTLPFFGKAYEVGPHLLLDIPDNIMDSIMHPNFSKINTIEFWTTVLSILIITSIESLAIAKAIDKIDPYKRKTDLNKDLTGIGLSTMVAGMIGGLPIIAVIIRSTVNIHNGAKTKWSNMYQGLLLLLFIVVLSPIMRQVPLCAFAILLVYTGFKLAAPAVFKQVYSQGTEQLIFFVGTMVLTLYTNLLIGLLGGLLLAMVSHMLLARVSIPRFFKMIYKSGSNLAKNQDGSYDLNIKGIANFLGILKIDKLVSQIPSGADVNIDLSETWEIADVTFSEGAAFTAETFNTTLMTLKLNKKIPVFTMEKEGVFEKILDRVMAFTGYKDVDFEMYPDFSKKFLIMGNKEAEIREFFTDEIIRFFENHQIYHLESNGEALVIFDKIKLARTDETVAFIDYGKELATLLDGKTT